MVRVRLREALTAGVREGIAQRWDSSPPSPQEGQTTSLGRATGTRAPGGRNDQVRSPGGVKGQAGRVLRRVGMGRGQAGRERKAGWKHAHGLGAWGVGRITPGAQEKNAGGSHQSSGVEMQILGRIKAQVGGRTHNTEPWTDCREGAEARVGLDLWLIPGRWWHGC